MVKPTTSGAIPNAAAMRDAPRTNSSAPTTSVIRPPRNVSAVIIPAPS